jgi:hypothetical protein
MNSGSDNLLIRTSAHLHIVLGVPRLVEAGAGLSVTSPRPN